MKTLQNNFTTPKQSKRLLELGVPVDSADCYIHISECVKYNFDEKHEEMYKKCEYGVIGGSGIFGNEIPALLHLSDGSPEYLPCWSVGRLVEIIGICESFASTKIGVRWLDSVDYIVMFIEKLKENECINFSKLEE